MQYQEQGDAQDIVLFKDIEARNLFLQEQRSEGV